MENKYEVHCEYKKLDVYRLCKMFGVTEPALQHALKKILFAGLRGHKSYIDDLSEAVQSIDRAIEMYKEEY